MSTTAVKKNQRNGVDTKAPKVQVPQTKPVPTAKQEAKPLTLEERIQKVDELKSLTEKRHRTITTLHGLRSFNFGSDDSCVLVISDSQGHKFQTGNTNLVTLLKDHLEVLLNDKVSALDDEIMGFKM
ncbi:MAG: hypothetical protein R2800_03405 [Flavipsychrobacter sp.]